METSGRTSCLCTAYNKMFGCLLLRAVDNVGGASGVVYLKVTKKKCKIRIIKVYFPV